jgi:hypothetical protein
MVTRTENKEAQAVEKRSCVVNKRRASSISQGYKELAAVPEADNGCNVICRSMN